MRSIFFSLFLTIVSTSTALAAVTEFPKLTTKEAAFFERAFICRSLYIAKYLNKSLGLFAKPTALEKLEKDYITNACLNIAKEIEALKQEYKRTNADPVRQMAAEKAYTLKLDDNENLALQQITTLRKALLAKKPPDAIDILGRRMLSCTYLQKLTGNSGSPFLQDLNGFGSCPKLFDDYNAAKANSLFSGSKAVFDSPIWKNLSKSTPNQKARIVNTGLTRADALSIINNYNLFLSTFTAVSTLDGLLLKEVKPASLLRKIGLESGDMILKINSRQFHSLGQLLQMYFYVLESGYIHIQVKKRTELIMLQLAFVSEAKPAQTALPPNAPSPKPVKPGK